MISEAKQCVTCLETTDDFDVSKYSHTCTPCVKKYERDGKTRVRNYRLAEERKHMTGRTKECRTCHKTKDEYFFTNPKDQTISSQCQTCKFSIVFEDM